MPKKSQKSKARLPAGREVALVYNADKPRARHEWLRLKRWLDRDEKRMGGEERARLAEALAKSEKLSTVYTMRRELAALWDRSNASSEQLLKQLQDWCRRAEASGIRQLEEFSLRLRCYA